mmetsp:Transcript_17612/g.19815  ORF Transcript_17612/g.19815 Transcript_17612/m.19815 type:complete len:139 (+) Transcript_17612:160-576(+)|eukprot:CAMPEP_0205824306 /NCGR_PEP_ID=MMETSP0206-20130828/20317_1 /ASSEMBLY_ACC=CAM_ASM_000279 /TAXON_ID=36767 /ORGANISM="Euplotes focardii, Strain TN1" /LENGTH=138 /DNA_ID=CAMNT_0053122301 /DNA_START=160 /DNA_END=576 /DNA_ORIENTATION=-
MKPDWDKLAGEFEGSSSVLVADADCTQESELCSRMDVKGYPTIKYFTAETGTGGEAYSGGRDFDSLKKFVVDTLEVKCDAESKEGCTEKEGKFIDKMESKDSDYVEKQITRLSGMLAKPMKAELKQWVAQRLNILKQL